MKKHYLILMLIAILGFSVNSVVMAQDEEKDLEEIYEQLEGFLKKKDRNVRFSWFNVKLGFNTLLKDEVPLVDGYDPTELKAFKSTNWGIDLVEIRINLLKHYLNLKTGIGVNYHYYEFKNQVNLLDGMPSVVWEPFSVAGTTQYKKNNLYMGYLRIPLMLNFESHPGSSKSFHISAGGFGGVKIDSRLHQKWNNKQLYVKDDFNLNTWIYGLTGSIGYDWLSVYVDYNLSNLFMEDRDSGYALTPLSFGVLVRTF